MATTELPIDGQVRDDHAPQCRCIMVYMDPRKPRRRKVDRVKLLTQAHLLPPSWSWAIAFEMLSRGWPDGG